MRIEHNYRTDEHKYYDMNGVELHDGDIVFIYGKNMKVFLTEAKTLGTDATNPAWIKDGRAFEGENGIYPFTESDEPILVARAGTYKSWDCLTGNFEKKEKENG